MSHLKIVFTFVYCICDESHCCTAKWCVILYEEAIVTCRSVLGAFEKLRKVSISFVMSVRPSFRLSAWNNSDPTGQIFTKFVIWVFFENCWENLRFIIIGQELLVSYKKTTGRFKSYLAHFYLEWEMFQTKVVEEIKMHISYSVTFFKVVPFITQCGKVLQSGAVTDWNVALRIACRITKAKNNIHSV
jgi:hypothetical protein